MPKVCQLPRSTDDGRALHLELDQLPTPGIIPGGDQWPLDRSRAGGKGLAAFQAKPVAVGRDPQAVRALRYSRPRRSVHAAASPAARSICSRITELLDEQQRIEMSFVEPRQRQIAPANNRQQLQQRPVRARICDPSPSPTQFPAERQSEKTACRTTSVNASVGNSRGSPWSIAIRARRAIAHAPIREVTRQAIGHGVCARLSIAGHETGAAPNRSKSASDCATT